MKQENKEDEIFIKYDGKRIWPKDKKYTPVSEGTIELNVSVSGLTPHEAFKLEIWEYDLFSPNDKLGVFTMIIDERGGPFQTDMVPHTKKEVAKYTLEWEAA